MYPKFKRNEGDVILKNLIWSWKAVLVMGKKCHKLRGSEVSLLTQNGQQTFMECSTFNLLSVTL